LSNFLTCGLFLAKKFSFLTREIFLCIELTFIF
jgi:hypothetical protein